MADRRRRLVAILSADVAGYSRLMEADEEATVARLKKCRETLAGRIEAHGGHVVDAPGDALLATFESAVDAVACAVATQRELRSVQSHDETGEPMRYRVGINLADVLEEEGRVYGEGVNVAARLESLAEPGGVCISGKVFDEVDGKVETSFEFLGEKKVKNITKPVRAYAVLRQEDLRVHVLGPMELTHDGRRVPLPASNKTKALLAYLLLTGRTHRRDRLCALLWDVADDPRAALRWCLSKLRPILDEPRHTRIVADRETVAVDRDGLWVDALHLRSRAAAGFGGLSTAELDELAGSFRGELLAGLDMPDYADFRAWCVGQREDLRRLQAEVLRILLERLTAEPERALPHARLLARLQPGDASERILEATLGRIRGVGLDVMPGADPGPREPAAESRAPDGDPPTEPSDRETTRDEGLSLVVLPFRDPSGRTEHDYFSHGIAEDVTTALAKITALRVIAPSSAFLYGERPDDPRRVASDLDVRFVLTGTVRRARNRVRVNAQLVDGQSGQHVWAERYDRSVEEVFEVQDELMHEIVTALEIKLTLGEQARLWRRRARSLEAYGHYLRGIDAYNRFTKPTNAQARQEFERAIEIDPQFPAAHHYLGWVYCSKAGFRWTTTPEADLQRAWELADRAIELDDSLADAYAVRSYIHLLRYEHEAAIAEAEKAVALYPNGSTVCHVLAMALLYGGSPEEAVGLEKQALRLSPLAQDNFLIELGHAYCLTSRFAEAIEPLEAVVRSKPYWLRGRLLLAEAYGGLDQPEKAAPHVEAILRKRPQFSLERWGRAQLYRRPEDLVRQTQILRRIGLPA